MTKLEILAKTISKEVVLGEDNLSYLDEKLPGMAKKLKTAASSGFKSAFNVINELIDAEITKVSDFPWMGERIHALKLYKRKMNEKLEEMEKESE